MNGVQLPQAVYQLQAQAQLDHAWMKIAEEAITQHAECIDAGRISAAFLKADTVRIATALEANDSATKAQIDQRREHEVGD